MLKATDVQARSLLQLCEELYATLASWYSRNAGETLAVDDLARVSGVPPKQVQTALHYMSDAYLFEQVDSDQNGCILQVVPAENVLRHSSLAEQVTQAQRDIDQARAGTTLGTESAGLPNITPPYVDLSRLAALRALKVDHLDLSMLLRLCEELNDCWQRQNFFAVAALLRTLLNHVPPVFKCQTFAEVANNVAGRSTKLSLKKLEDSSRIMANALLHQKMRRTDSLPSSVRVNYSHDLDILLGEICRCLDNDC